MRGRKPVPDAKRVNGDLSPYTTAPAPLDWLDPYARAEWERVAPLLVSKKLLSAGDLAPFACYCSAVSTHRRAMEAIKAGLMETGSRGQPRPHPAIKVADDAAKQVARFSQMFGLDPSSRGKAGVPPEDPEGAALLDFVRGPAQVG